MHEDTLRAFLRPADTPFPEDRLADTGLARQNERARAQLGVCQKRLDRAQLLIPPDDRRRHFVWIVTRGGRYAYGTPRLRAGRAVRRSRLHPCVVAVARVSAAC